MSITNFKLFGTEIVIVNSTPDRTTTDDKVLAPTKEEPIYIAAALTPTTTANNINTKPIFSNPNPNPSSSSGVSTDLGLGGEVINNEEEEEAGGDIEWGKMIKKRLTRSDLNGLSRLMVSRKAMEERVLSLMGEEMRMSVGSGLRVEMVDDDTGRVHNMVLKIWHSSKSYVINGGWLKYTKSRQLLPNDEIGLRWDPRHCCFHITVLRRAS